MTSTDRLSRPVWPVSQRTGVWAALASLCMMLNCAAPAAETLGQALELKLRASSTQPAISEPSTRPPHELAAMEPAQNTVSVLSQRQAPAAPSRHRHPELSTHDLVVVSVNAQGVETSRTVIRDPRIVRAETAEPSGRLSPPALLYRKEVIFSVIVSDPNAFGVRLYKPRWTGKQFVLDLIGEAELPDHG
jgi:hypothetical protein